MFKSIFSAQFIKYAVVGLLATGLDFLFLYSLVEFLHLFYLLAAFFSMTVIIWISFSLNKYWTFQNREKKYFHQFLKYAVSHVISLVIALAVLAILVQFFGLWYIYAKLFATIAAAITNFLIVKSFIFKPILTVKQKEKN